MPPSDIAMWTERLDAVQQMMDNEEWQQALKAIETILKELSADKRAGPVLAKVHLIKAKCLVDMAELSKAREECDLALAIATKAMDQSAEAETICLISNILRKQGDFEGAKERLGKALVLAKAKRDKRVQGIVFLVMADIHSNTPHHDDAEKEYREAILFLEDAKDIRGLVRAYHNYANWFLIAHQWERAIEMFTKCQSRAQRVGYLRIAAWAGFNKAECLMELGRFDEAIGQLDASVVTLKDLKDSRGIVGANMIYGLVLAKMGEYDKAEEKLLDTLGLARRNKIPVDIGKTLRELGRVNKWHGNKARARHYFKQALEVFDGPGGTQARELIEEELKELEL